MPHIKIQNRDFVFVGLQPWDVKIGSNCKDIANEVSSDNRVLYINAPTDWKTILTNFKDPLIKKRIRLFFDKKARLEKTKENLWVYYPATILLSINFISNRKLFKFLNKINNKLFSISIKKAIKSLGFQNYILFNDNEIFRAFYLKEMLKPRLSIFYIRDYLLAVEYWKKHGLALEPLLIKKSDVCLANSTFLAAYCKKFNDNSFYVGQGCDLNAIFNRHKNIAPSELTNFKRPIIGYIGALTSLRLDIDVIQFIADQKKDWSIVLIGPEDEEFMKSKLHQTENIYFLGLKKPEDLPMYVAEFDVCINPQLVNEVTIGNYPRKIDEYLAEGKPIVATNTPAMSIFSDHTYLANTKQDYVDLIVRALNENNPTKINGRIELAKSHTWENNVLAIYEAINPFL